MSTATALLDANYVVPDEEGRRVHEKESYTALLRRLSHQSVVKHFDAYADIPWDSDEYRLDVNDPRWKLSESDALGATHWYRAQPEDIQARIGLHLYASFMKIGTQFESVLKRGLLAFAADLPNGSPEFRYIYHEVIEEAQHSLMFQEFVNRTGFDIPGLTGLDRVGSRIVIRLGKRFPELFFMFVLGGEDPIDHVQRSLLYSGAPVHPLLKRIMQIHVTEEARHLCFARHFLKENIPRLSPGRRLALSIRTPILLSQLARLMMQASPQLIRLYSIPKEVITEAYTRNPQHRADTLVALRKVRQLCNEVGLITPLSRQLWRRLGIWEERA